MDLLSLQEMRTMNDDLIEEQITSTKKVLFEFRMKQATRQSFKPHIYKQYKKQLARLCTIIQEQQANEQKLHE
uniref:Large ribosomal subunit protein uL29c n=1 Tax=Yamadaella caenomyce TaxID=259029 RepID=A0A1G4NYZ8_9FLOR|nr:Ribosomal protein L29 [Yamadaella caenomyce]SCW23844.1 Ribosomal protein L29 [Yamadaella caenomyce]